MIIQGDTSGSVFFVERGIVKEEVRVERRKIIVALRGPGDIVGETANASGRPAATSTVAASRVYALRVSADEFAHIIDTFRDAEESLRRVLADRRLEAERDRISAEVMSTGQRLAGLVLTLARRYGVRASTGLTIEGLSQAELAGRLGISPRTVTRKFGSWRRRSIVSTSRRSVIVNRPDELRRIARLPAPRL
jgi:CRP-like cAMP-binding protein